MNIDELTIGEAKQIAEMFPQASHEFPTHSLNVGKAYSLNVGKAHSLNVGKAYLIRTVTMMYTGRVRAITDSDIELEDASWIADSGRYHNALAEGTLNEVEPYPDGVCVSRASLIDFAPWDHPLPREQQ